MRLNLTIFLVVGFIAQAIVNLINPSLDKGIDIKSIVACRDCGKK